jgi:hypothetical protein
MRAKKAAAAPLARDDGSVVVAGETGLCVVGPGGEVLTRTEVDGRPVGGLIPWRGAVLIVSQGGSVYAWQAPAAPRRVGDFGGEVGEGAMLAGQRTLVAVVDTERVVALDLLAGGTTLLAGMGASGAKLEGPAALTGDGVLLVTSVLGEVFGVDAHGTLTHRAALEALPAMFAADAGLGGIFGRTDVRPSPPLVSDARGRVAFARNSGRVGVVDEAGHVMTATTRLCSRPISLLPAGARRMMVACSSGSIAMYSDDAPDE